MELTSLEPLTKSIYSFKHYRYIHSCREALRHYLITPRLFLVFMKAKVQERVRAALQPPYFHFKPTRLFWVKSLAPGYPRRQIKRRCRKRGWDKRATRNVWEKQAGKEGEGSEGQGKHRTSGCCGQEGSAVQQRDHLAVCPMMGLKDAMTRILSSLCRQDSDADQERSRWEGRRHSVYDKRFRSIHGW